MTSIEDVHTARGGRALSRNQIPVVWRQRHFVGDLKFRALDVNARISTIAEIIAGIPEAELPRGFGEAGEVRINGELVPRGVWHLVRPKYRPGCDTVVTLHVPLHNGGGSSSGSGSKSTLSLVASIAVLLVAAAVSGGALGLPGIGLLAKRGGRQCHCCWRNRNRRHARTERKMGAPMTAIAIIKQSKAVHVLTDGAACNADGTLLSPMVKAWPIPHLNAVIAARGSAHFAPLFAMHAPAHGAESFDGLRDRIASIARQVSSDFAFLLQRSSQGSQLDLVVAGWSESLDAPACYFICNHALHGAASPPWEVIEIGPISLLPQTAAMVADLTGEYPNGLDHEAANPVADGLRILEIQRRNPFLKHSDGQLLTVGAGCFVTISVRPSRRMVSPPKSSTAGLTEIGGGPRKQGVVNQP